MTIELEATDTVADLAGRLGRAAARWPDVPAVVAGDAVLTYGELDAYVTRLAARIRALGVGPETVVGVLLPRGAAAVAVPLAIWRAGGAYLPLDPQSPDSRLAYLVSDADAPVVLATADLAARAERLGVPILTVDVRPAVRVSAPSDGSTGPRRHQLAYCIYTSGTTGRPKGVLVEHGSFAAMAALHETYLYDELPAGAHVALNNPATTDSYLSELAHLGFGRTLYVVGEDERRDPERMADFLSRHHIDVLDATPTQIRALLLAGFRDTLARLRVLILGGEGIDPALWTALRELSGVRIFNLYGPTECTVDVTVAGVADSPTPVLGHSWPDCTIHLLDGARRPVPDGSVGDLWVSGPQLARGYLHPSPAEQDRFTDLALPGHDTRVRAYRTGDLARRNADGLLEFRGRADSQVKVHGFRVELGEVEAALLRCPGVADARVGFDADRPANPLRAWVIPDGSADLGSIRRSLADVLPAHALPALAVVDRIPMAATGKTDLHALLALPAGDHPAGAGADEALCGTWCAALGITTVTGEDNFFELGGDSLSATQMTLRSREVTGRRIPIRAIFDHPTFRDYCRAVEECAR
jgi:amino acid adenylation domain-containing protein